MATIKASYKKNGNGGVTRTSRTSSSSSGGSSGQIGLSKSQVDSLKGMKGINQDTLSSYVNSGSVIGGKNNPNGRGRENVSAIPADGMSPAASLTLPPSPAAVNPGSIVAAGNIGLGATANGAYTVDPATGMFTTTPPTDNFAANQNERQSMLMDAFNAMGTGEADLAKLEKDNKLKQKQEAVSSYTGQLNSIVANSQAAQLFLEGQGRGQTSGFIGGEQARINREAAIAALPVQAQLSAAQGDLAMAEAHVDKLFQIKRQDAQALFNFKSQVINSVYDFADKQEQRRLDEVNKIETRKYAEQQDFLKTQRSLLSSAMQQGAPASVIEKISSATTVLDAITSAGAYNGDVLARQIQQAQLRKLNAPEVTATGYKAPEVKNINGVDKQWNASTGRWDAIEDSGLAPKDAQAVKTATDTISKITTLKTHSGLNSSVGPLGLTRVALGDAFGNKQDFIAGVENLISQQTLNTLLDLKSKGGTLGALSEKELRILESTASKISTWRQTNKDTGEITGYNTSESRFKAELANMESQLKQAQIDVLGYDPTIIPSEDESIIDFYLGSGDTFNPASYF